MTRLPKKRQRPKSGIERAPKREWHRHRKWLRTFRCVCTEWGCLNIDPIEVSHIRTAANSGTGLKPHDSFAVPMCSHHHQIYHRMGHDTFERVYDLNLKQLAIEFTRKSPDKEMRESLALVETTQ